MVTFKYGISLLVFNSTSPSFAVRCHTCLTTNEGDVTSGAKLLNADWLGQRALFFNNRGTFGNRLWEFWENFANTRIRNP